MTRIPSLVVAAATLACVLSWCAVPVRAADPVPAEKPAPPPSLIGLSRAEVIAARGKPSGERDRGDVHVMVYTDGTKIELRGGTVIAVTGGTGDQIIGADGTRYVPGADGNIQRPVEVIEPGVASPQAVAAAAEPAKPPSAPVEVKAGDEATDLPPGATAPPSVAAAKEAAAKSIADDLSDEPGPESKTPPGGLLPALVIGSLLRLGLTVLVVRLALHVIGLPFVARDVLKVSMLYVAVFAALHALSALGGFWEFIGLFQVDEVVSFVILACALTWFKIVTSGLTALKIAVPLLVVMTSLMFGVDLLIRIALDGK